MSAIVIDNVFWLKIVFIVVIWCEAFFSGCFPTWSAGCRENPKILGIANSFASGVFIAVALVHILPEEAEMWADLPSNAGVDPLFPLPYFLMFVGYTLILVIDKVAFDTHALFDHDDESDPVQRKLSSELRKSLNGNDQDVQKAVQAYMNPTDRFSTKLRASMQEDGSNVEEGQQKLLSENEPQVYSVADAQVR
jgi:zinc transporter ZupT